MIFSFTSFLTFTALVAVVRGDGIATLTLGDRSAYSAIASYTTTLQGTVIDIVANGGTAPTGVPQNGWDVYFSPDLSKQLEAVAKDACSSNDHNKCYQEISNTLESTNTDLQIRAINALAFWTVSFIAGVLSFLMAVDWKGQGQGIRAINSLHVPHVTIAQASSAMASSPSAIALVSGTSSVYATITPRPSISVSASVTPASITTQSADSGSIKQGDIVFTLTDEQAKRWQEIIARSSSTSCPMQYDLLHPVSKRKELDDTMLMVVCAASGLLANMYIRRAAAGLAQAVPRNVNWLDPETNEVMHRMQDISRGWAKEYGLDNETSDQFTAAAFMLSKESIEKKHPLTGDKPIIVPAAELDLKHAPASTCTPVTTDVGLAGCHMQGAIEACTTIYTTTATCLDSAIITASKSKKLIATTAIVAWTVTSEDLNAGIPEPTSTSEAPKPTNYKDQGNLDCGNRTDPGHPANWMNRDIMNEATRWFCRQQHDKGTKFTPGKVADSDKHIDLHYNNHMGDPVYVGVDWIDDAKCPPYDFKANSDVCYSRFAEVIDNCDTSNDKGYYYWKQGGSFFRDCIKWTMRRDTWQPSSPADLHIEKEEDQYRYLASCKDQKECDDKMRDMREVVSPHICADPQRDSIPNPVCVWDKATSPTGWCQCPNVAS